MSEYIQGHALNVVLQHYSVYSILGWGGAHRRQSVRRLLSRNKPDAVKPSCIWGQNTRIWPECRVTTPLWAPGADSGQRTKTRNRGGNFWIEKWLQHTPLGSPGASPSEPKLPLKCGTLLYVVRLWANKCWRPRLWADLFWRQTPRQKHGLLTMSKALRGSVAKLLSSRA